jgi:GDP-mannose 6-dehydrogenase
VVSDPKTAEILKYVNNAFHALKITFANEVGNICKGLGIDSHQLMDIFCRDTKLNISPKYLKPGFSYGGSCLPKDLKALKTIAHDFYLECPVLENIERSNEHQKAIVLNNIVKFGKKRIGFIGISFKEGTDDLRNSPIIDIIEQLIGKGYQITIYDKNVRLSKLIGANRDYILQKIPYVSNFIVDSLKMLIDTSEVIVVVNNEVNFNKLLDEIPESKLIYDLVNIRHLAKTKNYMGASW